MKKIEEKELDKISCGGLEWFGIGVAITTIVIFISGIIEGFTNPGRCSDAAN